MTNAVSTAVFDLETSDLEADRGVLLCAVIRSSKDGGVDHVLRIDETDAKTWKAGKRGTDKNLVAQVSAILSKHDVLVAHNGQWFDLPFLRTRQLRWGLDRLPDMKLIDPLAIARRKFRLRSNSLGRISDFVGIAERKTPLDMSVWADAMQNGTKASLDLIVEHCEADVAVLDGVLGFVKPYVKILDDRGSAL